MNQHALQSWLMVQIAAIAGEDWWNSEWDAGRLAAFRQIEKKIHDGAFREDTHD